jgi:hypothetical protein
MGPGNHQLWPKKQRAAPTAKAPPKAGLIASAWANGAAPAERPVHVYVIASSAGGVKIGIAENPHVRLRDLQVGSPHRLRLELSVAAPSREIARAAERRCHTALADHHMSGEWFEVEVEEARRVVELALAA